jgi:tripartite-type tricarboxylate transporter receptor subunit TctC
VKYDVRKFGVLGSLNKGDIGIVMLMEQAGISSLAEARTKEAALGSTGTGSAQYVVPLVMNRVMGTKFRLIPGYKSTGELFMAIDRGELSGVFTNVNTIFQARPQWLEKRPFKTIAQLAEARHPDFADVPLIEELLDNPQDKAVFAFLAGKVIVVPPDVPADRLAALRKAFAACMRDPEFLDEAKKAALDIEPRMWEQAADVLAHTVNISPDIIARVQMLSQVK